jgi:hypothetical protein
MHCCFADINHDTIRLIEVHILVITCSSATILLISHLFCAARSEGAKASSDVERSAAANAAVAGQLSLHCCSNHQFIRATYPLVANLNNTIAAAAATPMSSTLQV